MRDQLIKQAVFRVAGQNRRAIQATPQKPFSSGDIQATLARLPVMAHDTVLFQRGLDLLGVEHGAGFIRASCLSRTLRENDGQRRRRQSMPKHLESRGMHDRSRSYTS